MTNFKTQGFFETSFDRKSTKLIWALTKPIPRISTSYGPWKWPNSFVGGGWWWWWVVCKPNLVFQFGPNQALGLSFVLGPS